MVQGGLAALDGAGSYATVAANEDDHGGSGGAFDRPSAATGEGSVHNSFGAVAGRAGGTWARMASGDALGLLPQDASEAPQ
jgi:hypothetical protein